MRGLERISYLVCVRRAKGAKEEKTMDGKRFRKRALAVAAATVTTAAALSLGMGGTTNADTFPLGDVNLDGKVDLKDAQLALRGALRISDLSDMQFRAADVNLDNKVDLKDAQKILRGALHIEKIEGEFSDTTPTTPPMTTEKPDTSETPIESTVPTTVPTIQPTEVIKTTLEDGTVVITTPDEGVEGVDWEWRTATYYVPYCHCGKQLFVDEHGYVVDAGIAYAQHVSGYDSSIGMSFEEWSKSGLADEAFDEERYFQTCKNYILSHKTLSYKVRLK